MAFVKILDDDVPFEWRPTDEETATQLESAFQLRVVPDEVDREIRKRHTRPTWDKKQRRMVDKLDDALYVADVIDFAIVGWTNVQSARSGQALPCTSDLKARLPEKWKAEVLRLCSGKEGGEVVARGEQEKKPSASTLPGNPTN